MLEQDKEMHALLGKMDIPEPASNLEQRIIAAAKTTPQPRPVFGGGWFGLGPRLAVVASLAALAVVIFAQQEEMVRLDRQVTERQVAAYDDPYTVNGIPLLADIEMMEEEFEIDVAMMEYQG